MSDFVDSNSYVEKIKTEDDRHAERHIDINTDENGNKVKVSKLYTQPNTDVVLEKVITEKYREEVCERIVDVLDQNGNVVDRKVESVEPLSSRLQIVEHLQPQFVVDGAIASNDCNCATKEEIMEAIDSIINAMKGSPIIAGPSGGIEVPNLHEPAPPATEADEDDDVGGKWFTWSIVGIIVVEIGVLAWALFT